MRKNNTQRLSAHTFSNISGMAFAFTAFIAVGIAGVISTSVSAATFNPNSDTRVSAPSAYQADDTNTGPYHGSGKGYVKYYSPGDGSLDGYEPWDPNATNPPAAIVSPRSEWAAGGTVCGLYHAADAPDEISGQRLTTLASLGMAHLGVTGYLEHGWAQSQYNYVVLFDPGNFNTNACDNRVKYNNGISQAATYAKWIKGSKDNNLVVFAGAGTRDAKHYKVVNGKKQYDQGLRREIFAKLTYAQKKQVVVCEYADMNHVMIAQNFLPYMNNAKIKNPTQCPQNPDRKGAKVNAWRP